MAAGAALGGSIVIGPASLAIAKGTTLGAGASSVYLADVQVFGSDSLFGVLGSVIIVGGGAWLALRSRAGALLKADNDALGRRLETLERERNEATKLAEQKRDEKHQIASELAAERKIRDLKPVLEELTRLQQGQEARAQQEQLLAAAVQEVAAAQQNTSDQLGILAEKVGEQSLVLAQVVERLEITNEGRQR